MWGMFLCQAVPTLLQPEEFQSALVSIEGTDGLHRAAIGIIPTESLQAPAKSEVIFEKFGANVYFYRVPIQGDTWRVLAQATKTEKRGPKKQQAWPKSIPSSHMGNRCIPAVAPRPTTIA
jgi:hypothetical protein